VSSDNGFAIILPMSMDVNFLGLISVGKLLFAHSAKWNEIGDSGHFKNGFPIKMKLIRCRSLERLEYVLQNIIEKEIKEINHSK
jgi:hypothetical protein